jgi:photosystem II stability/assembly factor-like uncharacterized protein
MKRFLLPALITLGLLAAALPGPAANAVVVPPRAYNGLRWRNVGPFHGGRAAAVTGVPGEPGVYYVGLPEGGVWKTTSAGVTWFPIFDGIRRVDSVGAVAVAPSDPRVIYVGTGDPTIINPFVGSLGDGVWKSTNAGKTWTHVGLRGTVMIDNIVINPTNPNIVLVSALGDARHHGGGVWRTTNGGRTWTRVLDPKGYKGTRNLVSDAGDPNVLLAVAAGNGGPFFAFTHKPHAKPRPPLLFKSTDGGLRWTRVAIPPFPGRVAVAVAHHGRLIYIVGNDIEHGSGFFRSDNGGKTWRHMALHDKRIANGQGSYSCGVFIDPRNPNIVYTVSTALYRSTDGGKIFHAFKGAPGGEDYHSLWIDPHNPERMIVASDQGASVSINGGRTWSLWYTEPFAQIYHVATTHQFRYWIVGAQQDTGAVMIRSRGLWGQVNFTDWSPMPSSEFGYITPDPLNPHIFLGVGYGPGGGGSGMIKIFMNDGQWENVGPNFGVMAKDYRSTRSLPKKFDTVFHPQRLYAAYQCLLVSTNLGFSWRAASPDLTVPKGRPRVPCGKPLPPPPKPAKGKQATPNPFRRGPVIEDFSISRTHRGVIWTVSTNNQIYRTDDGGRRWINVTNVPGLPPNTHFHTITAGDHAGTAYLTARIYVKKRFRKLLPKHEDYDVPLVWRTTNGGRTWTEIVRGLPRNQRTGSWVNALRVDPRQPGLLFLATATTVDVSFDHGNHWEPLTLNLPSTDVTDLDVHTSDHEADLVISTFGRGFWVLDDITPLEQLARHPRRILRSRAYLFKPETAVRARANSNWDQPFSVEVPHAPNPPFGVIVDYELRRPPKGPIRLVIKNRKGRIVRVYTSVPPPPIEGQLYPRYWLASPASRALPTHVGLDRFVWNLRYGPPPALHHDLENQMNNVAGTTTPGPHGPLVIPGVYTLELTVDGRNYVRHVTVVNDPRVGQSPHVMAALRAQQRLTLRAYRGMEKTYAGFKAAEAIAKALGRLKGLPPALAARAKALEARVLALGGTKPKNFFLAVLKKKMAKMAHPKAHPLVSFYDLNNDFNALVSMVQVGIDMPPTSAQHATLVHDLTEYARTVAAWGALRRHLKAFNRELAARRLAPIPLGRTGPLPFRFSEE